MITADEFSNKAEFYEIKRNPDAYDPKLLEERKNEFLNATHAFSGYNITIGNLSLGDM